MNDLLAGLMVLLAATNHVQAATNYVAQKTGIVVPVAAESNDPVEKRYKQLMIEDDEAQDEVDRWIKEANEFAAKGVMTLKTTLKGRIEQRLDVVRKNYLNFLETNPAHVEARVAYGSFLNDIGEEDAAQTQYEKALGMCTNNPAIYNNLANIYGHHGPITNAFVYYAKAIELNPNESVYYHNLGTTVYLFRKDAKEFYQIDEQGVFDKAMALYDRALQLDPTNFPLATDIAQTYYGIAPLRVEDALKAWRYALSLARDEVEREGVYIHLARFELNAGRYDEARRNLNLVTNSMYQTLKTRVGDNIDRKEKGVTEKPPDPPAKKE